MSYEELKKRLDDIQWSHMINNGMFYDRVEMANMILILCEEIDELRKTVDSLRHKDHSV